MYSVRELGTGIGQGSTDRSGPWIPEIGIKLALPYHSGHIYRHQVSVNNSNVRQKRFKNHK